ncbi:MULTISPECIES: hypothetical protein [Pseudomonas]|uniref:Uncharacterized protein n=1 Tax=Pseudomonas fluorescens TaxID=294 RepID=A0A159ZZD3_PSEFL|nr:MULTISPECIES: hypothetical protein [Pseudomonas]AMZ73445.1 hypothetical protein TK06_20895 [Pseudomonas fluorescens]MCM2459174.1 hypothetical protein [Pseudomonas sp. CG7]
MKVKIIPAVFLFLGSYFPLSVILLLQDVSEASWKQPICWSLQRCTLPILMNGGRSLGLFIICLLSLGLFTWVLKSMPADHQLTVKDSKTVPNDLINYVFPYVVSFMGLDLASNGKFYGFLIFLTWMFLITYRSGQILMNPLLLAIGWQLHELKVTTAGNTRDVIALAKTKVHPGDTLKFCVIQGIYVLAKRS